jgi:outer membrane immunogenic protein
MNRVALCLAALVMILGGRALAADMAVKAPSPSPQPVSGWTGCYIGGNVGDIRENDTTTVGLYDPTSAFPGLFPGPIPPSFSYNRNSWLAGGQIGCNYQFTKSVVGIETDFDDTSLNGGQSLSPPSPFAVKYTSAVTQGTSWLGTTRARIGTVWNNVLLYATGGIAYGKTSNTYFLTDVPSTGIISILAADSATQLGWTVGGGLEVGLGQWSVKGEALYYDLGNHSLAANCTLVSGATCGTPNTVFTAHFANQGVIARIGLNYHFNIGPVAAKY